ncbi:MAG: FxsA family protein [Gammaproteobacteria bacterium]|nr:FxsA family protein [Gammaproteobacteria bacterium]MBU1653673.1 FxsA family protein [Gammaproteobacteria bacterium]MBU1962503.1 FxsA family protein [Gammaproteobacteria bacterium]
MILFLALLIGLPLLELYLLIEAGSFIGALPTILLSLFTAALGGYLMRRQGIATAFRARISLERGEVPALEMLEGAVVFLAGVALLLPGFFTDALGFLALIPPLRQLVLLHFLKRTGMMRPISSGRPSPGQARGYIEAEWQREDETQRP